jgi:hypothetical protein
MNVKLFKKLIKEAVTEAIYEELPDLINEALQKQQKQQLREMKTVSFNSSDVMAGPLPTDVRNSLAAKLGMEFGIQQSKKDLKVIDSVDTSTGEKINPYLNFIADAAANMTPQDIAGLKNLG